MLYQLHNISTTHQSRTARRDNLVRTRKVFFKGMRIMPHRACTVTEQDILSNRAMLLDLQKKGVIQLKTGDGVAFQIPEEGPLSPPPPPPRPKPALLAEMPPDLRGERMFRVWQKPGEGEWMPPQGWTKTSPMAESEEAPAPPQQQHTPLADYPEDIRNAASLDALLAPLDAPSSPAPTIEHPSAPPVPEASLQVPADMLLTEEDGEEAAAEGMFTATPAPQAQGKRAKGRRRR